MEFTLLFYVGMLPNHSYLKNQNHSIDGTINIFVRTINIDFPVN